MWVLQASVTREKIDPETQRLREESRIRFPNNRNIHPSVFYLTRPLKLTKDRFPTSNSLSTLFRSNSILFLFAFTHTTIFFFVRMLILIINETKKKNHPVRIVNRRLSIPTMVNLIDKDR